MTNQPTKPETYPESYQRGDWMFWIALGSLYFGGNLLIWIWWGAA